jgi:hypothetical protein
LLLIKKDLLLKKSILSIIHYNLASFADWLLGILVPIGSSEKGSGRIKYKDGTEYIGEYKDGFPEGKGKFLLPSGNQIEGTFRRGMLNGSCLFTYADGGSFSGKMKYKKYFNLRDIKKGRIMIAPYIGTRIYPDGCVYIGKFGDEFFHGKGEFKDTNGERWIGRFKKGKLNGFGRGVLSDGGIYVGNFKEGLFHGKGEFKYANGDRWIGRFKNDKPHGWMTIFSPDGWKSRGRYENGVLVSKVKVTSPEGITEVENGTNETAQNPTTNFGDKGGSAGRNRHPSTSRKTYRRGWNK